MALSQDVLLITTGQWTGNRRAWSVSAANVRKQANVYALGVRPNAQRPQLQEVTENDKNVFMVGSYNLLRNYWNTMRYRIAPEQGTCCMCSEREGITCLLGLKIQLV